MTRPAPRYSLAILTLGAAAIHFAVAPEHFSEYVPYGVFFICLGLAQVGLAIALVVRPGRKVYAAALAGTLTVIAIWLASRTTGLPIGPRPWRPEEMAFTDLAATLLEAIACIGFAVRLFRPFGGRRGRVRTTLKTLPAMLFAPLLAFVGVGGALNPMPDAYNAAPPVAGVPATSVADLVATRGAEPVKAFTLTASVMNVGGQEAWVYNRSVPGPELRVTQGDWVRVTLVNHLPDATSIHWHGLKVPNADDGVAGITQDAVQPGHSFVYEFPANDVGTYWYHSHQETSNQIPKGVFGSLVVEPKNASLTQRDYTLLVHLLPNSDTVAINGRSQLHLDANPGDTVRLRVIDAIQATDMNPEGALETPVLLGARYTVAALDGHDIHEPQLLGPERIALGMGQRADLVFTMPASGAVSLVGLKGVHTKPWEKQSVAGVTIGSGSVPADVNVSSLSRFDLTGYGTPAPDPVFDAARFDVTSQIVLSGGPAFRNGSFDFADTFNGHASPYIQPIHVRLGDVVRLHIVNRTQGSHPIHIHGHIFSVLAKNGRPISGSPVHLDAILVGPGESWDVGFLADNPGIWMLHCHILVHAAGGMSMTINYDGFYTPYAMGTRSGNVPE